MSKTKVINLKTSESCEINVIYKNSTKNYNIKNMKGSLVYTNNLNEELLYKIELMIKNFMESLETMINKSKKSIEIKELITNFDEPLLLLNISYTGEHSIITIKVHGFNSDVYDYILNRIYNELYNIYEIRYGTKNFYAKIDDNRTLLVNLQSNILKYSQNKDEELSYKKQNIYSQDLIYDFDEQIIENNDRLINMYTKKLKKIR